MHVVPMAIKLTAFEEFRVGSDIQDFPMGHHHDLVGRTKCRDSIREYHNDSLLVAKLKQRASSFNFRCRL